MMSTSWFSSIKSYLTPSEEDWESWQRSQGPEHYQKSKIWDYFIAFYPKTKPPEVAMGPLDPQYECFHYCFGEFTPLIVRGQLKPSPIPYFRILLDVYSCNKGYVRTIKGEPEFIVLLRRAVMNNDLSELANFQYSSVSYKYDKIHAHTVAEYSLSRLLALLTENALVYQGYNTLRPISVKVCHEAWSIGLYSKKSSPSLLIKQAGRQIKKQSSAMTWDQNNSDFLPSSWPEYCGTLQKCSKCGSVCTKTHVFGECKECHITSVCSICGGIGADIGRDGLPKCATHV